MKISCQRQNWCSVVRHRYKEEVVVEVEEEKQPQQHRVSFIFVHVQRVIPHEMGPSRCRATPAV